MSLYYGDQFAKDYVWENCKYCDFLQQLQLKQALAKDAEKQANIVIKQFASLDNVRPAHDYFTFLVDDYCYVAIENGEETLKHLEKKCLPKELDLKKTIMLRAIWIEPSQRNKGQATKVIETLWQICKTNDYSLFCVPRIFEPNLTGIKTPEQRMEIIKVHPSSRTIGGGISEENLDEIYDFYQKLDFIEYPFDKHFKVQRGIMIKTITNHSD